MAITVDGVSTSIPASATNRRPYDGDLIAGGNGAFDMVHAAGGVVLLGSDAGPVVAVVHRPHRFDWTLPKGKAEPGEPLADCALREVEEETGLSCDLGLFVGRTRYRDRKDRLKVVSYWLMTPVAGDFSPNDEVDELRWLQFDDAHRLLTYDRDRELLATLAPASLERTAAS